MPSSDESREAKIAEAIASLRPGRQVELGLADGTWIAGIVSKGHPDWVELDVRARHANRPRESRPPEDLPAREESATVARGDVVDVVIWIVTEGPE